MTLKQVLWDIILAKRLYIPFEISSPYWWHDRVLVFAEYSAESTNKREFGAGEVFAQRRYRKSSVFAYTDVPKGQNQRYQAILLPLKRKALYLYFAWQWLWTFHSVYMDSDCVISLPWNMYKLIDAPASSTFDTLCATFSASIWWCGSPQWSNQPGQNSVTINGLSGCKDTWHRLRETIKN